jgi:hypothetical protein
MRTMIMVVDHEMLLTRRTNGFRNVSRFLQRNAKSRAKLLHRCAWRYA